MIVVIMIIINDSAVAIFINFNFIKDFIIFTKKMVNKNTIVKIIIKKNYYLSCLELIL